MDLNIKPDPDLLEDTISQSAEFLDEDQNNYSISDTARNSTLEQKVFLSMVGSLPLYDPCHTQQKAAYSGTAVPTGDYSKKFNSNRQQVRSMVLPPFPYDPCHYPLQVGRSDVAVPTVNFPSNIKSNLQQKVVSPIISSSPSYDPSYIPSQKFQSSAVVPNGGFFSNISKNLQQNVPTTIFSSSPHNPGHIRPQVSWSTTASPTRNIPHKYERSGVQLNQLKKKVISRDNKSNEKLTSHWRKKFLSIFEKEGCSTSTIEHFASTYKLNAQTIIEFYGNVAKEAEHYVHEECDSLSFNNITQWLKHLSAVGISDQCNYEAAIVLNAITNNENHPKTESMDGIDLKAIYKFLSNALMGLPQQQLSDASARFLSHEFQNLINEANTDEADNDVRDMKAKIEDNLVRTINGGPYKLDPLNTNTEGLAKCYELLKK